MLPERLGGWRAWRECVRVAPRHRGVRVLNAPRSLRFTDASYPQFPQHVGSNFWTPNNSPESVTAPESDPPGEFVSEDLRADCARFLEELRVQIKGRVDLLPGSTGWVPGGVDAGSGTETPMLPLRRGDAA
jgi:hypothetical protein